MLRLPANVCGALAFLMALLTPYVSADPLPPLPGPVASPPRLSSSAGAGGTNSIRSIIILKEPGVAEVALRQSLAEGAGGGRKISPRARRAAAAHATTLRNTHRRMVASLTSKRVGVRQVLSVSLNGLIVDRALTQDEASQLLPGEVLAVYKDKQVQATLDASVPATNAPAVWALSGSDGASLTGSGVRVGIIDTGIDYTHADLGGCLRTNDIADGSCAKVVGGYDFVNNDLDPFDDHGHGTHCAATAAGNGGLRGVAPDAKLYAYKVLAAQGWGYMSDVIAAIERSVDPNGDGSFDDRLDVISLSLGGSGGGPDDVDALALDRAVSLGVVAVVAAGNSGPAAESVGSPGTSRRAITVGAATNSGGLASFSSRGPVRFIRDKQEFTLLKPDVIAPGVSICAALSSQSARRAQLCRDNFHQIMSGTSMATPHVAGVAALVRQAHPTWSPDEVKSAIKRGADTTFDDAAESINAVGLGFVDAAGAVAAAQGAVALDEISVGAQTVTMAARVPIGWSYTVSAALGASMDGLATASWSDLAVGVSAAASSTISVATSEFSQGVYTIRLLASAPGTAGIADYTQIKIQRFEISEPKDDDVVNLIDPLAVKVTKLADSVPDDLFIEYSVNGGAWSAEGVNVDAVALTGSINLPPSDAVYSLDVRCRIVVRGVEQVITSSHIRVDPKLKSGFPVRIHDECGESFLGDYQCQSNWVVHPVVADLEGDGLSEILVWRKRSWPNLNEILVIDHRGALKRTLTLDAHPVQRELAHLQYYPRPLVVTDLDGDARPEIVVVQSYLAGWSNRAFALEQPSVLTVYNGDGRVREGFPLLFEGSNASVIAGDLNRDGRKEIIVRNLSVSPEYSNSVVVVGDDGTTLGDVQLKLESNRYPIFGLDEGRDSVVGDFDEDNDLEVAVFDTSYGLGSAQSGVLDTSTSVHVMNWNEFGTKTSVVPGFSGFLFGNGVPVPSEQSGKHNLLFPSFVGRSLSVGIHGISFAAPGAIPSTVTFDPEGGGCAPGASGISCGFYNTGFILGKAPDTGAPLPLGIAEALYRAQVQIHAMGSSGVTSALSPDVGSRTSDSAPVLADVTGDEVEDLLFFSNMQSEPVAYRGVTALTSESGFTAARTFSTERGFYPTASYPPTAADLDNDGKTDIIAASLGDGYLSRPVPDSFKGRFSIYAFGTEGVLSRQGVGWHRFGGGMDANGCLDCVRIPTKSVEAAPRIVQHPQSGSVTAGDQIELRVEASGQNLRYQWEALKVSPGEYEAAGWYDLRGATRSSLVLAPERVGEMLYRVRVSGDTRSTLSAPARIEVAEQRTVLVCPLSSGKASPGICGCSEVDDDEDADGTVDCLERRAYQNLGKASFRKSRGRSHYVITVPYVADAKMYRVILTQARGRRVRSSGISRTSKGRRFVVSDLPAGSWRVRWSASLMGIPRLSSVSGEAISFRVK
jgi:subtilisin family serine protease